MCGKHFRLRGQRRRGHQQCWFNWALLRRELCRWTSMCTLLPSTTSLTCSFYFCRSNCPIDLLRQVEEAANLDGCIGSENRFGAALHNGFFAVFAQSALRCVPKKQVFHPRTKRTSPSHEITSQMRSASRASDRNVLTNIESANYGRTDRSRHGMSPRLAPSMGRIPPGFPISR